HPTLVSCHVPTSDAYRLCPPPTPPPFPYTTLFRSARARAGRSGDLQAAGGAAHVPPRLGAGGAHGGRAGRRRRRPRGGAAGSPEDRKSTRLNSSHERISDAVFPLQKKTYSRHGADW